MIRCHRRIILFFQPCKNSFTLVRNEGHKELRAFTVREATYEAAKGIVFI